MAIKISIILTGISIGLLLIYGADVAIGGGTGQGFLPFDHKARGIGLGMAGAILPIISYFISKTEKSKVLGVMILVAGLLIVVGSAVVLAMPSDTKETTERNALAEFGPVIAVGIFIVALGIIKIIKSK